jgi:hypothetical protein
MIGIAAHAGHALAVVLDDDPAADAAVAAHRPRLGHQRSPSAIYTCPSSTRTGWRRTQPSSGATAQPSLRPIVQPCSGHETRSPKTIPCDSGPPRMRAAVVEREHLVAVGAEHGDVDDRPRDHARAERRQLVEAADVDEPGGARGIRPSSLRERRQSRRPARTGAGRCRGLRLVPRVGLAGERELQPLPQRPASLGVVDDALLHVVHAHARDVVHGPLEVPALLR